MPSVQLERKAHAIRDYVGHLTQRPDLSEYARGVAFVQLLKDLLIDADPQFLQDYLGGMEHSLAGPKTALYNRGRVDALYGNLIIEFKRSLAKSLPEAEEQIRKYLALLYCHAEERARPFIGMATDGIQFVTYAPRLRPDVAEPTPGDIQLVEIEKANFESLSPEETFYWLDRYFVRKTGLLAPRTESIVKDFGPTSGSFVHAMNLLDTVWRLVARSWPFSLLCGCCACALLGVFKDFREDLAFHLLWRDNAVDVQDRGRDVEDGHGQFLHPRSPLDYRTHRHEESRHIVAVLPAAIMFRFIPVALQLSPDVGKRKSAIETTLLLVFVPPI